MNRDKVRGMFLGIAIGDALGMPAETFTAEKIQNKFGRITKYLRPDGHQWYRGRLEGTWTDDTQLSLVVAESLIEKKAIDLDDLAARHIETFCRCNVGWGGSSRDAVMRLAAGIHWSESGIPKKEGRGTGNGVAMKVAPVGAYFASIWDLLREGDGSPEVYDAIANLTFMTHKTGMALVSAWAQIYAVEYCLNASPDKFSRSAFLLAVWSGIWHAHGIQFAWEKDNPDNLSERLENLSRIEFLNIKPEKIAELFGGGTSYVYNSLPFSYTFFLRNPRSIEALYDVVNAGGDTDSNGSIVGALLGALNGTKIFPEDLVNGLWRKDEILKAADNFCDAFNIGEAQ